MLIGLKNINRSFVCALIVFCSVCLSFQCYSAETPNTPAINPASVEALIQQYLPNTPIGLYIQDVETGNVLYQKNADLLFQPASNTKLFTVAAALHLLSPDFQYKTTVGVLNKDVYFKFSGDPSLTLLELQNLVKTLKTKGIHRIDGNIILDNTLFEAVPYGPGWVWGNLNWYYSGPVETITLNQNAVKVVLSASNTVGEKIKVFVPETEPFKPKIENTIISATEEDTKTTCQLKLMVDNNNKITLSGCWPISPEETPLKIAIKNPSLLAKNVLEKTFKNEGITVKGRFQFKKSPDNINVLATHTSPPLSELIKTVLVDSNNLYADCVLKTMGILKYNKGTFQTGSRAMNNLLQTDFAISMNDFILEDGSGISRYNLVSPQQIGQLLHKMALDDRFSTVYLNALGVTGQGRLLKEIVNLNDRIIAKTGSLYGVDNLSGYILNTDKKPALVFSIMINNFRPLPDIKKNITQFKNALLTLMANP